MADSPADWMSFADYLGLNEASLRELEAAANQQRAQADDASRAALGASYQEASRDVEAGGQGNLSATASYGDFLKAQRAAQQASAVRGDGYEAAARGSMMAPGASWTAPRNEMQGRLDQRRVDIGQSKANVAKAATADKARTDAQANAFTQAKAAYGGRLADESRGLTYFGAQQSSLPSDAVTKARAEGRYGSIGAARAANRQQQMNFRKLG